MGTNETTMTINTIFLVKFLRYSFSDALSTPINLFLDNAETYVEDILLNVVCNLNMKQNQRVSYQIIPWLSTTGFGGIPCRAREVLSVSAIMPGSHLRKRFWAKTLFDDAPILIIRGTPFEMAYSVDNKSRQVRQNGGSSE